MSSILRALKKLENEPRHQEDTHPLDSKFVPLADTGPQKTSKGLIMTAVGTGIVCGLVILAGWWLFSETKGPAPAGPQKISRQAVEPAAMVPAKAPEAETPQNPAAAVEPAKAAADIAVPPKTADLIPESEPAEIAVPPAPAVGPDAVPPTAESVAEPAVEVPASPGPEITEQVPADEEDVVAGTRDAPEVAARVQTPRMPALKDPEIKLQAITWSKDPQRRIVVINNRILRQGDAILGYRIDAINQDDIVLSEAGKKWELAFRIK